MLYRPSGFGQKRTVTRTPLRPPAACNYALWSRIEPIGSDARADMNGKVSVQMTRLSTALQQQRTILVA
jgi:hypothetical protein